MDPKDKMMSVRFSAAEFALVKAAADGAHLPPAVFIRSEILRMLDRKKMVDIGVSGVAQ